MTDAPFTITVVLATRSGFPFAEARGAVGGVPEVVVQPDEDGKHAMFTGYAKGDVDRVIREAWRISDVEARGLLA